MIDKKLKVYRMNEYEWWADYSEEEARKNYIEFTGEEDGIEDMEEEARMDTLKYKDEDMKVAITFAEQLARSPIQGLFATTEQ